MKKFVMLFVGLLITQVLEAQSFYYPSAYGPSFYSGPSVNYNYTPTYRSYGGVYRNGVYRNDSVYRNDNVYRWYSR